MSDPWLTIIGIGTDGPSGLTDASRAALAEAEFVFGGPRHLELAQVGAKGQPWPVPFTINPVLAFRGRKTVILASGDPFWHGAGGAITPQLARSEWVSHPAPSSFQLAANELGWKIEETTCLGLHAAPFARLYPVLNIETPVICTLRDGAAVGDLADWLRTNGHPDCAITVMERLGGPEARIRVTTATGFGLTDVTAPVIVALRSPAPGIPRTSGLPDDMFAHDGQITKRPIRALTLSALAPRAGARLWDLGAGSGSISVEWCLAGGRATAVERRADRVANIRANAAKFGVEHRLTVVEGASIGNLAALPEPSAVFIGGGCDADLLAAVWQSMPVDTQLVINSVTLETESLLVAWHVRHGGTLMRFDLAEATPLGRMRGWSAARPVVQWSVTK
ncbi:MAG: precorrin-6y C5,15-methyltransferase (decarboxylating) subunit CbiE [Paracoccaceae bacterium]